MNFFFPSVQFLTNQIDPFRLSVQSLTQIAVPFKEKIVDIVTSCFFCGVGAKEFISDGVRRRVEVIDQEKQWRKSGYEKTRWVTLSHFAEKLREAEGHIARGVLIIGSGICGSLTALQKLEKIHMGKAIAVVNGLGNGFFMFSNLMTLQQNLQQYNDAVDFTVLYHNEPLKSEGARRARDSAVLGIINNIGYIAAGSMTFLGLPTMALLLGFIAAYTGCLKVLYDYVYTYSRISENPKILTIWKA